jgi:N6-L-threonylcarbamoyladenine synthase
MLASGDLNFSFSGLKTAVLTLVTDRPMNDALRTDIAAEIQAAIVDVLTAKSLAALDRTGLARLVVAGGVGANRLLRERLSSVATKNGYEVYYPPLEFCTDNGAMIAFAGALRLKADPLAGSRPEAGFTVRPRWDLEDLIAAGV